MTSLFRPVPLAWDNPDLWLQPVMLVTGRKIRAQDVVPVQHSGLGELRSVERWTRLCVLRSVPSACLGERSHRGSERRLAGRALDGCDARHNPAANRTPKKPPPSTRPGGVRVAKCLPVNRDTRNLPPTTACAVPPNEGSRRQKTPPSSETWATQVFQSPSLVVNDGETQRCRRSASGEKDVLIETNIGGAHTSLAMSRSLNFWILPVEVFGSSANTT
jgi:hypothetical protein